MIKAIYLGNFKAFAKVQKIPIKPLTIVFGPNSSGKSSFLHGLLFAHEAHTNEEPENMDVHRPRIGGDSVDLGGFRQFVHRHDASNRVEWGVEIDTSTFDGRLGELLESVQNIVINLRIGRPSISIKESIPIIRVYILAHRWGIKSSEIVNVCRSSGISEVKNHMSQLSSTVQQELLNKLKTKYPKLEKFAIDKANITYPLIEGYEIIVDDTTFLRASLKRQKHKWRLGLDELDDESKIIRRAIKAIIETATTTASFNKEDYDVVRSTLDDLVPTLDLNRGHFLPKGILKEDSPDRSSDQAMFFAIGKGSRKEDLTKAIKYFLPQILDELICGLSEYIGERLNHLRYLGPLRSYPSRHLAFSQDYDTNWYAGGGYAWDRVRQDEQVREKVNSWLSSSERMKIPYQLLVRNLYSENDLEEPLWNTLDEMFVDDSVPEPDLDAGPGPTGTYPLLKEFDKEVETFKNKLAQSDVEIIKDLVLFDIKKNTILSHRDVGIGVSQVLPVLVYAFAAKDEIILMEQPELHLHPALQAELGDVFIETALGHNNTFILETHSEHLILRLLRRIRETTAQKNNSTPPIKPDDICLLYVNPDDKGSELVRLRIDKYGRLIDPCPDGFFEEDFEELF